MVTVSCNFTILRSFEFVDLIYVSLTNGYIFHKKIILPQARFQNIEFLFVIYIEEMNNHRNRNTRRDARYTV